MPIPVVALPEWEERKLRNWSPQDVSYSLVESSSVIPIKEFMISAQEIVVSG